MQPPGGTYHESYEAAVSLRALAWLSGTYDLLLGIAMLFFATLVAGWFGAPAPIPRVNAELNGVFATALALGYFWAGRDPESRKGYFWVAGVFAKGVGAVLFLLDYFRGGSPPTFLLFVATDGTLAALTAWCLLKSRS